MRLQSFHVYQLRMFLRNYFKDSSIKDNMHIVIPFKSQLIDHLRLPSVFYDKSVCVIIPDKAENLYPPKVYYHLNNPICLRFCN